MNGSTEHHRRAERSPDQDRQRRDHLRARRGHVSDGFSPQINIVRMDGQRGVLVTIYKTGSASTLDVVSNRYTPSCRRSLPCCRRSW